MRRRNVTCVPPKAAAAIPAGISFERNTRQRGAILAALTSAGRPLATAEILEVARTFGSTISLATVYRSIRALVDEGSLATVELPGGTLYELAGKDHHHHFACERCSRVYELEGCFEPGVVRVPRGFRATSHALTVYGVCGSCGLKAR